MNPAAWLPKSFESLRHYDRRSFAHDLLAGVTVGLVALPLAMAFAISSGVPPQSGLYCAVIAGFLISALGGSRAQIGGPTGAFVVVVSGHRGPPRIRRPADVHDDGRGAADRARRDRHGHRGRLHSAAGHRRLHQLASPC
jgi:hypothetical protein